MTTAIVLAGGLGTRLRDAVPDVPKPLAPVAGRPFLEHLLERWAARGVERFVLAVGHRHEAIQRRIGSRFAGVPIEYSIESTPLGTGGGLLQAASRLPRDRRFVLLNGDTWFDVPLDALERTAVAHDADWCLALFRAREPGRYMGPRLEDDGRLSSLAHDDATVGRPANGGVYLVHPRSLQGVEPTTGPVSLESMLLPAWLAAGQRFAGCLSDAPFIDIGVPEDWRRAGEVMGLASREVEAGHA